MPIASTQTQWGYFINASGGTGAITVFNRSDKGFISPKLFSISVAGSATTDYATMTDYNGKVLVTVPSSNTQIIGGARMDGLTVQVYGGTACTVSIFNSNI